MSKLSIPKFDWKYIFGEVILIFVGINLAIWFNNWNTSKTIEKNKVVAIAKIKGEIQNNLNELIEARKQNNKIPDFINDQDSILSDQGDFVLMSVEEMAIFRQKYGLFYKIIDSTAVENNKFRYRGDTFINLEIPELSRIAWETSKATGIFNEFGFDCLYELEGMYNLQGLVEKEIDNALSALQQGSIKRLVRILSFIDQLDRQLEDDYQEVLQNLEECG